METTEEILEKQLELGHNRQQAYFNHRMQIKNWCITVWTAASAIVLTQKDSFTFATALSFLIIPILIFWLNESMFGAAEWFTVLQISKLERRIADKNYKFKTPSEIFIVSNFLEYNWKKRAKEFIVAIFTMRTTVFFYLLLIVVSIIAVIIIK